MDKPVNNNVCGLFSLLEKTGGKEILLRCYEYALLLGDYRIAYVFLQFMEEDEVVFPIEYLPEEYGQRENGYSIYLFQDENGDKYGDL